MKHGTSLIGAMAFAFTAMLLSSCQGKLIPESGAKGDPGPNGEPGQKGDQGDPGQDAYELYLSMHPDYQGDIEQWMDDLVNGRLAEQTDDGLVYAFSGRQAKLMVSGYHGVQRDVVIPDTYHGIPVVGIAADAFSVDVDTVTLGANCATIQMSSFRGSSVKELKGVEAITSIEALSFVSALNMKTFDFAALGDHGEKPVAIAPLAFSSSGLAEALIPASLTDFGFLYNVSSLEVVAFEDGVTSIPSYAVRSSKEIYIPSSVESVASSAILADSPGLKIYCEAPSKPAGWADDFIKVEEANYDVVWGAEMPK